MKEKQSEASPSTDFLQAWQNIMNRFWSDPSDISGREKDKDADHEGPSKASKEALLSFIKSWGALSSAALSDPLAMGAISNGIASLPEVTGKFLQSGLSSFLKLQQQLAEKLSALGKSTEAYTFDSMDQDTVKAWSEFYEKEIRQYLKVPQLGLVRFYQERFNQVIDKYNIFNATFAEFAQILAMPIEKTFKVMQDKIEEMLQDRTVPEDPHEFYRMWMKILEGHYMTLFKSPKYGTALANTLNALEEYLKARNQLLSDLMQSLPIPTNKDLDELYAEIYHLKKRVKEMEKGYKEQRKSVASGG
jgi:hypothetical protein